MNSIDPDPIHEWRAKPEQPAKSQTAGWTVEFATDAEGHMPALDYLEQTDSASDRDFPVQPSDITRLIGLIAAIQFGGPGSLAPRTQIEVFVGADKTDGMCELRIGAKNGHRLLCFKRNGRRFIVTNGFPKPSRPETPAQEKTRARAILAAFERGAGRALKAFRQHG